jgi:hypothetical protein
MPELQNNNKCQVLHIIIKLLRPKIYTKIFKTSTYLGVFLHLLVVIIMINRPKMWSQFS